MARSSSSERVIPPHIKAAILAGDTATLSKLGSVGGRRSGASRRAKRTDKVQSAKERLDMEAAAKEAYLLGLEEDQVWLREQELMRPGCDDDYNP